MKCFKWVQNLKKLLNVFSFGIKAKRKQNYFLAKYHLIVFATVSDLTIFELYYLF